MSITTYLTFHEINSTALEASDRSRDCVTVAKKWNFAFCAVSIENSPALALDFIYLTLTKGHFFSDSFVKDKRENVGKEQHYLYT